MSSLFTQTLEPGITSYLEGLGLTKVPSIIDEDNISIEEVNRTFAIIAQPIIKDGEVMGDTSPLTLIQPFTVRLRHLNNLDPANLNDTSSGSFAQADDMEAIILALDTPNATKRSALGVIELRYTGGSEMVFEFKEFSEVDLVFEASYEKARTS